MKEIKEQIVIDHLILDCDISLVDPDTNEPSEVHVWLDETAIMYLTTDNNYHNITEQMALVSSEVRRRVNHICYNHGITITCECFGVANGKMYILYFCK